MAPALAESGADIPPERRVWHIREAGIVLHALTDWKTTLDVAERRGYFNADQVKVVREFLADPPTWSKAHGGV